MPFRILRDFRAAVGTQDRLGVRIPKEAKICFISCNDDTTPDLHFNIALAPSNYALPPQNTGSVEGEIILDAYQDGDLVVNINFGFPFEVSEYNIVTVTYFGTVAGDALGLTVGFDSK